MKQEVTELNVNVNKVEDEKDIPANEENLENENQEQVVVEEPSDLEKQVLALQKELEDRESVIIKQANKNKDLESKQETLNLIAKNVGMDTTQALDLIRDNILREKADSEGRSITDLQKEYQEKADIERMSREIRNNQTRMVKTELMHNFANITSKKAETMFETAKSVFGANISNTEQHDIINYLKGAFDLKSKSEVVAMNKKIEAKNSNKDTNSSVTKPTTNGIKIQTEVEKNSLGLNDGQDLTKEERDNILIATIEEHIREQVDNGGDIDRVLVNTKRLFPKWIKLIESGKVNYN